jgi:hypothetical protein
MSQTDYQLGLGSRHCTFLLSLVKLAELRLFPRLDFTLVGHLAVALYQSSADVVLKSFAEKGYLSFEDHDGIEIVVVNTKTILAEAKDRPLSDEVILTINQLWKKKELHLIDLEKEFEKISLAQKAEVASSPNKRKPGQPRRTSNSRTYHERLKQRLQGLANHIKAEDSLEDSVPNQFSKALLAETITKDKVVSRRQNWKNNKSMASEARDGEHGHRWAVSEKARQEVTDSGIKANISTETLTRLKRENPPKCRY